MSKAAKRSLLILIVLLLATLGFAAFSVFEKQTVEKEKLRIQQELDETVSQFLEKERKYIQDVQELNNNLTAASEEKARLEEQRRTAEAQAQEQMAALSREIQEISDDRDKWKRRIDTIREERDNLLAKIDELTKQLEEKPEPQIIYQEAPPAAASQPSYDLSTAPPITSEGRIADEAYWSKLLQQNASLEIDINKLKEEISAKSIEIVELKQKNSDLQLEADNLKHEQEQIGADVQHKADMIDNISLELARTKNDKKYIADRVQKLNAENNELRLQVKQLLTVKNALEKSIVRLNQEKDKMEGKLGKTETVIQSKIDEIWQIKEDLDRSIREAQSKTPASEVELPPIVVSSNSGAMSYDAPSAPGFNGKVISVNEANNFVIVDIGENSGIRLGDALSVYRDSKYIARLEVIQVRKDISAADLKDQWSKVKVGDIIR
ncbi:MAG: hypothetical protein JW847_01730 [Candidatus Omnitrophica bacterium]|nr:hypothetical protein [Candidatus Omnitrophota bacterium]